MRPCRPSVSARTQQGIRNGRGARNRSCPRNRERRGPFHPCHWGDLGRRKGLTTREPGDLPTTEGCRPGGVSRKSERRDPTRGIPPVGRHGDSRSSLPPLRSANETGIMTTDRAATALFPSSTATPHRRGTDHGLGADARAVGVAPHRLRAIATETPGAIRAGRVLSATAAERLRALASWTSAFVLSARRPDAAPITR